MQASQLFNELYDPYGNYTGDTVGSASSQQLESALPNPISGYTSPTAISDGPISSQVTQVTGAIKAGKTKFDNTESGYILGQDDSVTPNVPKFYIGNASNYLNWDGSTFTITGLNLIQSFTASETISAGAALALGYYQTDGGVKFDSKTVTNQSTTTLSVPLTVASNSNRILVVVIMQSGNATITNVKYNNVALATLDTANPSGGGSGCNTYIGYLIQPTTGGNNITATIGSAASVTYITAYSYYNVDQSTIVDAHSVSSNNTNTTQSLTATIPSTADFVFQYLAFNSSGGSPSWTVSSPNNQSAASVTNGVLAADNGQAVTTANQSLTYTGNSAGTNPSFVYGYLILKPAATASFPAVVNANASNSTSYSTPTSTNFRSSAFIGFANAAAVAGGTLAVNVGGISTNLSGLTPTSQYYLANSDGAVQTSAGANTRKVGIALSTTNILVTNIW